MSYQDQITEQQQRLSAAYQAFRAVHIQMTPPPSLVSVPVLPDYKPDNVYIRVGLGVVLIGSMIVSGSHTIPTFAGADPKSGAMSFGGLIIGLSAFFMLEAAIVAFAYIRTQRHYQVARTEPENLRGYVNAGLGMAFAVAILGNVDYTLRHKGVYIADWITTVILLGMALSAPVLAFITGDVLAMYQMQDRGKQRRHLESHEQKVREIEDQNQSRLRSWEDELAAAWNTNKGRWGGTTGVRVEKPSAPQIASVYGVSGQTDARQTADGNRLLSAHMVSDQTDGRQTPSGLGFRREASGVKLAVDWLDAHPEGWTLGLREAGVLIGVNKDTVSAAKKFIKQRDSQDQTQE